MANMDQFESPEGEGPSGGGYGVEAEGFEPPADMDGPQAWRC